MVDSFPGFPPETLKFLRQLKKNNRRDWFLSHKETYLQKVRAPMTELVLALGRAVQGFAPEMVVDPKRAIYRIYRDIRFSEDKTPYKTRIASIFVPRGIPKHSGAALYFHISPEEVLIAGGVYMPAAAELRAIRLHIADRWEELNKIINRRQFKNYFGGLEGEKLARAPKGFTPDHPGIDFLRHKQLYVYVTERPTLAQSPRLFARILKLFVAMMPLVRFLNAPLIPASHHAPDRTGVRGTIP